MSSFSENLRILVKSSDPRYLAIRFVLGHVFFRYFSYLDLSPTLVRVERYGSKGVAAKKNIVILVLTGILGGG